FGAGIVGRRGDDLVVFGAIGIGADIEDAVALVDFIFAVGEAGRDEARLAALVGIDQPDFAGLVIMGVDDQEFIRQGLADADEETGILFLIDDRVRRLLGADLVATDAVGA